ncbi:hypothetical protein V8J88_16045 [Massilia sp. W12]|uniref:hypothetical protein n=1 Tax=Massilia sp. W12 TaxID=3126507 RepID=UPI0030CEA8DD
MFLKVRKIPILSEKALAPALAINGDRSMGSMGSDSIDLSSYTQHSAARPSWRTPAAQIAVQLLKWQLKQHSANAALFSLFIFQRLDKGIQAIRLGGLRNQSSLTPLIPTPLIPAIKKPRWRAPAGQGASRASRPAQTENQ